MSGNNTDLSSDLAKADAHANTAADYDDVPELTDADFARGVVEVAGKAKPGRLAPNGAKQQVTLRVDRDVLLAARASGAGWQARANGALRREFIERMEAERDTSS